MIGTTLAHYEITAMLGKGGMGEVYRARDTKLGREVAVKLLPPDLTGDSERLARFRREAQLLASLNHPNIAGIHGLEEADGRPFLVMELAEGEDLSQRIARGPVSVDEATAIAREIAEGLEAAHDKGIVHRDLKPANVMVSPEGKAKILDFGLARAYVGESANEGDPALSPTITAAMTQAGVILGSAAYMSPEQAKGREVDRRTDIWAFGVIFFEMITGRPLFEGETVSETMASVLKDPVAWDRLPDEVPASIRGLLERCLERDPRLRLRDIGEARIHLGQGEGSTMFHSGVASSDPALSPAPLRSAMSLLPWLLFAVAAVALVASLWLRPEQAATTVEQPLIRVALEAPPGTGFHLTGANPAPMMLSPDGSRVVFGARDDRGSHQLWLREFASDESNPISGTEGGQYPFWSPDGGSVAYFANGALRVVDLSSRTNRQLTAAEDVKGGCWLEDGTILITRSATAGISRVDLNSGEMTELTSLEGSTRANSHRLPRPLPGEKHYLYAERRLSGGAESAVAVMAGRLDGGESKELLLGSGQAEFANGYLLYLLDTNLFARPFDPVRLEFLGPPAVISEGVGIVPGASLALYSTSTNGTLVFHPGHRETLSMTLAWYSREGERLGTLGEPAGFGAFDISPDGQRVVFTAYDNQAGVGDLFLHEVETDVRTRLTFADTDESDPLWSPDGKTIYYRHTDGDMSSILALEPEGRDAPRVIYRSAGITQLSDVSPDGRYLSFAAADSNAASPHSFVIEIANPTELIAVDEGAPASMVPRFSPDGRWISYAQREPGGWTLYVKTFPITSRKWQLTDRDAFWYAWDPAGDRIYHQWAGSELYQTEVDLSGSTPRVGQTIVLLRDFEAPLTSLHAVRMTPDRSRFLVSDAGGGEDGRPARLVFGWPKILDGD